MPKISNKGGGGGGNDELFGTKPASQCSTEHYKSLKLNFKACDSCWLVIGIHRKNNAPLGLRDMHPVCRTWHEGNSGSKWRKGKEDVCDSVLKSIIGSQTNAKTHSLPVIRAEFWCSIPPKINCSVTEQAICKLPIFSCLKGISPSKEDVKLPGPLKKGSIKDSSLVKITFK